MNRGRNCETRIVEYFVSAAAAREHIHSQRGRLTSYPSPAMPPVPGGLWPLNTASVRSSSTADARPRTSRCPLGREKCERSE